MNTNALVEAWLRNEVVPALREHEADPSRAIPLDEVFDRLEERYQKRIGELD